MCDMQLTVFFLQEVIISGLYIFETAKLLKLHSGIAEAGMRRVMCHLILVNVYVVLLDISILCLEYTGHYNIQTAWKPLVYSVKLKVEFSVLNHLVEFSQRLRSSGSLQPTSLRNPTDVATGEGIGGHTSPALTGSEQAVHSSIGQCCRNSSRSWP